MVKKRYQMFDIKLSGIQNNLMNSLIWRKHIGINVYILFAFPNIIKECNQNPCNQNV